ncbi:MAG: Zn-dependent hydrolase [Bacteroidales bacterium]|nr:Zn-dependent hydrolase [Bacteroidales bacterium]
MKKFPAPLLLSLVLLLYGCKSPSTTENMDELKSKLDKFYEVTLNADISHLTGNEKKMLPLLFETADIMNDLFWYQAYGNPDSLFSEIQDEILRKLVTINFGPWNRLDGNAPFSSKWGAKPLGANFYPPDMSKEEFEAFQDSTKTSFYTIIRRDKDGKLISIPYHVFFKDKTTKVARLLEKAAKYADDPGLKNYLILRAKAFLNDDYLESDLAWMDMKTNTIDFVVGPIENYEDQLYGYKTSYEAYILIKDKDWSRKLNEYAQYLPELQKKLPVEEKYKTEKPGSNSDLAAYDVIYYAGDCNAGSKTIAINLPNDERVHALKGSRRLQLKNSMKAKFDAILVPIANELIAEDQLQHITFDAFFENVMFHEVAHGLGIFNTLDGKGTVREALKETYTSIEEGKADILGLFLITELNNTGITETDLMDNYVTFMAGIFRSIRFGATSSHAKANLIRFNYFKEKGAFVRNEKGKYAIDFEKMKEAMNSLSNLILTIQGDGDYNAAGKLIEEKGIIYPELSEDLHKLEEKNIPVDVVFKQGPKVLGL